MSTSIKIKLEVCRVRSSRSCEDRSRPGRSDHPWPGTSPRPEGHRSQAMTRFMKSFSLLGAGLVSAVVPLALAHRAGPSFQDRSQPTAGAGRPTPEQESPRTPVGLPAVHSPDENPFTSGKAELGRLLFFDRRLSSDGSVSCASCHD